MRQTRSVRTLCALFAILLPLAACQRSPDVPQAETKTEKARAPALAISNPTDPHWVRRSAPARKIAIVFVHGLFGDTVGTWSAGKGKSSFFDFLLSHQDIADQVDLFAFGFTSNSLGPGSLDIRESAIKLEQTLEYHGVLSYDRVVFVAHSLGGLVTMRFLIGNRHLSSKVPLVVLYGTPQEGSQIAMVAEQVANNPALLQLFPADRNAHLQQLDDDWRSLPGRPRVVCGYEKLPTFGVVVVPWTSASRLCTDKAIALDGTDHNTIVKPDRADHPSIVLLVNALRRDLIAPLSSTRLDTPDFTKTGTDRVYRMTSDRGDARLVNPGRTPIRFTFTDVEGVGLYIVPDDTPRVLEGLQSLRMRLILTYMPTAKDYRFKIGTDIPSEIQVVVKAPEAIQLRTMRDRRRRQALSAIDSYLEDPHIQATMRRYPADGSEASDAVVEHAMKTLWHDEPQLSVSTKWLLTADVLTGIWPELAGIALRRAEAASSDIARTQTAQHLAGMVAGYSGQKYVFNAAPTPYANVNSIPIFDLFKGSESASTSLSVAARMKEIPQLRSFGLSLEGDVYRASGEQIKARRSYVESANLRASPGIAQRIQVLDSKPPQKSNLLFTPSPGGGPILKQSPDAQGSR